LTRAQAESAIEAGQMCTAAASGAILLIWPEALVEVRGKTIVIGRTLRGKKLQVPLEALELVANGVVGGQG